MTVPRIQESSFITISPYPEIRRYSGFKSYPLAKEWLTSSRVRVTLPRFSPGIPQLRCPRWHWEQLPVETGRGTLQLTSHRSEYWWAFSSQDRGLRCLFKLEESSSGSLSGYCGSIPQRPVELTSRAIRRPSLSLEFVLLDIHWTVKWLEEGCPFYLPESLVGKEWQK